MRRTPVRLAALSALTVGALALSGGAALAQDAQVDEPARFTSMFTAMATPDMVIGSNNQPAPGQPGATGTFDYRINSDEEIICYDLRLEGVTGEYQSPARTATHIHEAAPGMAGPPRIAFPNPQGDGEHPHELRLPAGAVHHGRDGERAGQRHRVLAQADRGGPGGVLR